MDFRKSLMVLAACTLPAGAQDVPRTLTVTLTSYAFAPHTLALKVNVPIHLHLANNAAKGHNFSAPEFFASVTLPDSDRDKVRDGEIELKGGESTDLTVTPVKPGTYRITCTHFMHGAMGMTGSIVVQ